MMTNKASKKRFAVEIIAKGLSLTPQYISVVKDHLYKADTISALPDHLVY